ncbi:MAG: TrkH family potassium uptake protein, partial [Candidatus Neomarinimicrobiota bacterium]
MRILLLIKNSFVEFKRLIHPNAIIPVRFNGSPVNQKMISNILAFVVFYILIFVFGTIVMSGMGYDLDSAMGAVIATLGNIGPGIGEFGSGVFTDVPSVGKWFLS